MNPNDKLMAWAQITLSFLIICGALALMAFGKVSPDALAWLRDIGFVIVAFWFSRQRQGGIPDASQTVTQTSTHPDGTKTVITSPATAPVVAAPLSQAERPLTS